MFVRNFNTLVDPLVKVIKQSVKFAWGETQEKAFNLVMEKLIIAPLLVYI